MAAFLDRAFHLPSTATDSFTDDNGTTFEGNINRLAASGITKGCSPTTFCPKAEVTRGQMAAFLHRALTAYPVTVAAAAGGRVRPMWRDEAGADRTAGGGSAEPSANPSATTAPGPSQTTASPTAARPRVPHGTLSRVATSPSDRAIEATLVS